MPLGLCMVISRGRIAQNALIVCDGQRKVMSRNWGWMLIAAGLLLVAVSMMQTQTEAAPKDGASFGGVILIGPIPIIFGSSPQMAAGSMLLAVVLMFISFLLFRRRA